MAAILNSGGAAAAAPALPVAAGACAATATSTATGTVAVPGAPAQGASAAATDVFTQLIADMIGASNTPAQQGATPSVQDPAAIEAGANASELSHDEHDTRSDATDDEDAGALAIAALLPGLSCLPPATPIASASSGDTNTATRAIDGGSLAQRVDTAVTQAAVDELSRDSTEAAGNPAPADTTKTASADSQNTTPSTQMHALLATHAAATHAAATPDVDATPDATLSSPVGTPAWKDELGTQLTWMAVNGREAASLRLSPEHLGPLEIRISVREGEASVYFGATNADTRSALEQSLPRLRELFASQGLVLADAGVSRDAPRNAFKPSAQPSSPRSVSDAAAAAPVKSVTLTRLGLIDTYV